MWVASCWWADARTRGLGCLREVFLKSGKRSGALIWDKDSDGWLPAIGSQSKLRPKSRHPADDSLNP